MTGWLIAAVCLTLGAGLGARYARTVRARSDWLYTRSQVPVQRRIFFGSTWKLTKFVAVLIGLAVVAWIGVRARG